jgi:hydrogenase expression/formation protein HypC
MLVESVQDNMGTCTHGAGEYRVRVDLVDAEVGDYVLVHAGIAVSKLDEAEARETLELLRQVDELNRAVPRSEDDLEPGDRHRA